LHWLRRLEDPFSWDRAYSSVLSPAPRRLNTIIDGCGSRTAFTYSAYLSVKILVSSADNGYAVEPLRK